MQEIAQEGLQSSVNIVDNGNREEAYNPLADEIADYSRWKVLTC